MDFYRTSIHLQSLLSNQTESLKHLLVSISRNVAENPSDSVIEKRQKVEHIAIDSKQWGWLYIRITADTFEMTVEKRQLPSI